MNDETEERMIGNTGYEVRQAFRMGGKEIVLAENMGAENGLCYLVCQCIRSGIVSEYSQGAASGDYLEVLREFTKRINDEIEAIQTERDVLNLPSKLFTSEDCFPLNYDESIADNVVAIKADMLSPEYRRGDVQLVYVVRGNGVNANPHGNAVYCYHLNTGEHTRFERYEVLGVVKELPEWAVENLARITSEMDKPTEKKKFAGRYEITQRIEVGQKVFALGHNPEAVAPYGTWQGYKSISDNFDCGHYFADYEAAKTDLHVRAAKAQERMDIKERDDRSR